MADVGSFTSLHSCSCDVQVHVTRPGHVRSSAAMRLKAHTQWTLHMKRQGRICGSRRFCLTRLTLPPVLKHETGLLWVHMTPLTHQQGFALSIMATLSCTNTVANESSAADLRNMRQLQLRQKKLQPPAVAGAGLHGSKSQKLQPPALAAAGLHGTTSQKPQSPVLVAAGRHCTTSHKPQSPALAAAGLHGSISYISRCHCF